MEVASSVRRAARAAAARDAIARCWGWNHDGQIGDGTTTPRPAAVAVEGLGPVAEVIAGDSSTCARGLDGAVVCWGRNIHGQLGNDDPDDQPRPVVVAGLGAVLALRAGAEHVCALGVDRRVRCWGLNQHGQLGRGTHEDHRSSPQVVPGLDDVTASCWGLGASGQLQFTPQTVDGLTGVTQITAGVLHTCARTADGSAWCWGVNSFGQIGTGSEEPSLVQSPTRVRF